ncbi:hypothetical protein ZHAS_00008207 [Anopheles sinensis]|uniref:Uncharacterized protein n=1 Tax=Anopheles sinensis TaxID=74873 RepID=A0A084VS33_ANOSI|nr:hypothetical protein ZHAS_00008207 [Anopheles sinensis]
MQQPDMGSNSEELVLWSSSTAQPQPRSGSLEMRRPATSAIHGCQPESFPVCHKRGSSTILGLPAAAQPLPKVDRFMMLRLTKELADEEKDSAWLPCQPQAL